jgi:putative Holliday junction resolvase
MIGAALGIDLGDRTIGLAVSDGLGLTAQGLRTLERHGGQRDLTALQEVCAEREIARIVIGLPRNMDGSEGDRARKSRAFAQSVHTALSLPVFLYDERLSTAEAERLLISADVSRKKRAQVIDMLAAQIILQGWLDSGCPETDPA